MREKVEKIEEIILVKKKNLKIKQIRKAENACDI